MPSYLICGICGYKSNISHNVEKCPNCNSAMKLGEGNKNAYFENKMKYPEIDMVKCTFCGKCTKICCVSAIIIKKPVAEILIDKCTNCGKCIYICPEKAILR